MASIKLNYSRSRIAVLVAFFVPLFVGYLFDRGWLGLLVGFFAALAVWRALGDKVDDRQD